MEQNVRPVKIISPITGHPVSPTLRTIEYRDRTVVEARWIDPSVGTFLRKGIVSTVHHELNESVERNNSVSCPDAVRDILLSIAHGEIDAYDVMNHPNTMQEREASKHIQQMYDDVVVENPSLHPDDDFESIFSKVEADIEKLYS